MEKEPKFNVKLGDLKKTLQAEAKKNERSLHGEIIHRLKESIRHE